MLRGLGRNTKHWLGFEHKMAGHFRAITIDAREIGQTKRGMSVTDTIYDLADDVVQVLDDVGSEKSHVLGVSLGGMVAMAMGVKHPARTSSLVIVNSSIAGSGHARLSRAAWFLLARAVVLGPAIYDDLRAPPVIPYLVDGLQKKVAKEWLKIDQASKVAPAVSVNNYGSARSGLVGLARIEVPAWIYMARATVCSSATAIHCQLIPGRD